MALSTIPCLNRRPFEMTSILAQLVNKRARAPLIGTNIHQILQRGRHERPAVRQNNRAVMAR